MDRTLECGCRFMRGSIFPCDAHQRHEGSLVRALLDELDRYGSKLEKLQQEYSEWAASAEIEKLKAERDGYASRLSALLTELHEHTWHTQTDGGFVSELLARPENAALVAERTSNG